MRVRFAPSPTGYLHIGGARTCLFNWLFARHHKGAFVLRIEDTDQARSQKEYLDEILDSLKWLGLDWDELYFQSQRFETYRRYAQKLLQEGRAYLAEDGSGALIFKMPQGVVKIQDLIHGEIQFDTGLIKDQVLIKSDQSPTYNFACVVDDAEMRISHIIRGDDHISNTPKQVVLYEALGFTVPQFAHIPMILGKEGGRMSKRAGATAITEYRRMGFLAEGLVNYLMLLGWSPGNNQEIISLSEATQKFDIAHANKTAATFDMNKLLWMNSQYIRARDPVGLVEFLKPFLLEQKLIEEKNFDGKLLVGVLELYKERATTLIELVDAIRPFLATELVMDPAAREKYLGQDLSREFAFLKEKFNAVAEFKAANIEAAFRSAAEELGVTTKHLIHPLRVALSGKTVGPGMFEFIEVLGKEKTIGRIEEAIASFKKGRS
ncbi:MAG: glutamate--tRNA ligase [Candidatus Omnitrophota bacterium]